MTEVRFSGLSSLSFLDGRGTCSKELYTEPQFSFGGFCRIIRPVDFQQHSQKNQRACSAISHTPSLGQGLAALGFRLRFFKRSASQHPRRGS
jgi:hypothetical protein